MDCSTCSLAHSSFQVKRCTVSILSSHGWSVSWKVAGVRRICACSPSRGGKRIWESAHRSWLTDGNPLCGWAKATSQTSIWIELTKELCHSVRRLAEQSWSEEDLRAVVETPQRPKTPTADIQFAAEPLALLHAPEDDKEEPTAEHEEDEEMQGKPLDTKETPGVSSSGRGEKRTETQENMSVKKRVMMKSPKRPATPVSPPDDPVKR